MSDPFTELMTGRLSEKMARFDNLFYGLLYAGLGISITALGTVILFN
jgi:hypothetical protein